MSKVFKMSLIVLLLGFTLNACGQANSTLPAFPIQTTLTATPTNTLSPTPSATATLTPFPTLSENRPYLMLRQGRESQVFSIYDANGVGRKIVELPSDGHIKGTNPSLNNVVSPNGAWLVFYTGSTHYLDRKTEIPVMLKLLNIKDGTVKTVADIVAEGYEQKLGQLAEKLKKLDPDGYKPRDGVDWVDDGLITAFEWGIYSIAWSPDSRTLAFAAQIDGLSSDVYLYNLEIGAIQQAEDSLQSVTGIRWSPDGKNIIFENSEPGYGYMGTPKLYVISPGKKVVNNPQILSVGTWIGSFDSFTQTWSPTGDWFSPNTLLRTWQTPDAGSYGIDALNINTGQSTPLWGDIFGRYAVDEKNKIIIVSPSDYTHPENLGLYLITSTGLKIKIFDGLYYLDLFFRGGEKHRFLVQGISNAEINGETGTQYPIAGSVIALDLEGKPTSIGKYDHKPQISISPDYDWLLVYDAEKLDLYDKNDEFVKTFPIPGIERIVWRPDSQTIFYSTVSELYMLSLPDGEPKWIDQSNIKDAVWLP